MRFEHQRNKIDQEKMRIEQAKYEAKLIRNQRSLAMQFKSATKVAIEQQNKYKRDIIREDELFVDQSLK